MLRRAITIAAGWFGLELNIRALPHRHGWFGNAITARHLWNWTLTRRGLSWQRLA